MNVRIPALLLLACVAWASAQPLAVVMRSKGDVQAGTPEKLEPAAAGTLIHDGTRVRTGENGRALVRFLADNSITEIKQGTTIDFATRQRSGGTTRQVLLRAGEAAFGVVPGKGRDLRFETATTVASVRGTGFRLKGAADGNTQISVDHGVILVCNRATGESMEVPAGKTLSSDWNGLDSQNEISSSNTPTVPTASFESSQVLEVDFLHPSTGAVRTIGVTSAEIRP
ncbi:MAG: FecR domain-containing protein [Fibrobacteria bacterium]|nr:FecR domain-containing protein [Fibrobacteria bacterium]